MKHVIRLGLILLSASFLNAAEITVSGNVTPGPASSPVWNVGTYLGIMKAEGGEEAGSVTVAGEGALLTAPGISMSGGNFRIEGGGQAETLHTEVAGGLAIVTGIGSTLSAAGGLIIDAIGVESAVLHITDGATASFLQDITIGTMSGPGALKVSGPGSLLEAPMSYLTVGSGSLLVENGATLRTLTAVLGGLGSTEVTVTGAGTYWEMFNAGEHYIGRETATQFTIADGGRVDAGGGGYATLGGQNGTATIVVTGEDSVWNIYGAELGSGGGTGTLQIENGGAVNSASHWWVGSGSEGIGAITVTGAGSTFTASALYLGEVGNGTVTIANGGTVTVGTVTLATAVLGQTGTGTLNIGSGGLAGTLNATSVDGVGGGTVNFNHTDTITFAPTLLGMLNVNKLGSGTTSVTAANTYTGGTVVSAGSLLANNTTGSAFGSGAVTVETGATVGGDGFVGGLTTVESGGRLAPGDTVGTLTFTGGLVLESGAILDFHLGAISDMLAITGGVFDASAGGVTFQLSATPSYAPGVYTLIDWTGATDTAFTLESFIIGGVPFGSLDDYSLVIAGSTLQLTANAIPEPSTYAALCGAGALGLVLLRRRRHRRCEQV